MSVKVTRTTAGLLRTTSFGGTSPVVLRQNAVRSDMGYMSARTQRERRTGGAGFGCGETSDGVGDRRRDGQETFHS